MCFQQFYPVNYLRNVALRQANTEHVFLLDVDFLPMPSLYDLARQVLASAPTIAKTLDIASNNKLVCSAAFVRLLLNLSDHYCHSDTVDQSA